jgi:hypothetical protein
MVLGTANTSIELTRFDLSSETSLGPTDLYLQPLNLGWHFPRADLTLWYALTAPSGRYVLDGSENSGLGMWANEYGLGGTVYFDRAKEWHASTMATYVSAGAKQGTPRRPGSALTLEGGAGWQLMGVAYYAQWKLTDDEGIALPEPLDDRHRYFAIGPEVGYPLMMAPRPLILSARYMFELGNKVATEGNTLFVILTIMQPTEAPAQAANGNE